MLHCDVCLACTFINKRLWRNKVLLTDMPCNHYSGVASNELRHRTFERKLDPREVTNYLARFRLWCRTQGELIGEKKNAHFLWSVGKEAYDLIQTITFPREPTNVPHSIRSLITLSVPTLSLQSGIDFIPSWTSLMKGPKVFLAGSGTCGKTGLWGQLGQRSSKPPDQRFK